MDWGCLISEYGWYRPSDDSMMEAFPYCWPPEPVIPVDAYGEHVEEIWPFISETGDYIVFAELGTLPFTYVSAEVTVTVP